MPGPARSPWPHDIFRRASLEGVIDRLCLGDQERQFPSQPQLRVGLLKSRGSASLPPPQALHHQRGRCRRPVATPPPAPTHRLAALCSGSLEPHSTADHPLLDPGGRATIPRRTPSKQARMRASQRNQALAGRIRSLLEAGSEDLFTAALARLEKEVLRLLILEKPSNRCTMQSAACGGISSSDLTSSSNAASKPARSNSAKPVSSSSFHCSASLTSPMPTVEPSRKLPVIAASAVAALPSTSMLATSTDSAGSSPRCY